MESRRVRLGVRKPDSSLTLTLEGKARCIIWLNGAPSRSEGEPVK